MSGLSLFVRGWFFLFLLVAISYTVGYVTLSPLVIIPMTLAAFHFIPFSEISFPRVPKFVYGISILGGMVGAFPLLVLHPFFDVSTDALHTIIVRVMSLTGHIPATLDPYASYPVVYPMGFHSVVAVLAPLIPIPEYLVMWLMGLFFLASIPIFLYLFLIQMGAQSFPARVAVSLFSGAYIFYFNGVVGLYPALMGFVLGLLSLILLVRKNNLAPWVAVGVWLVHPGVGLYMSFVFLTYLIWKRRTKELLSFIPSLVLLVPLFSFFSSFFSHNGGHQFLRYVAGFDSLVFFEWLHISVFAIGNVIVGVFIAALFYHLFRRSTASGFHFFLSHALFAFVLILAVPQVVSPVVIQTGIFHKLFEWIVLAIMGVVAFSSLLSRPFSRPVKGALLLFLVVLGLYANIFNYNLVYYRNPGEKITLEGAHFAQDFYAFDPQVKRVFYFTPDGSKMSQYANKSPYDPSRDYFMPPYIAPADQNILNSNLPYFQTARNWKAIWRSGCFTCAKDLNLDYIVTLEGMTMFNGEKPLFTSHGYSVYSGRD